MPETTTSDRMEVLRSRLRGAQSIMGCGDNPDIGQAAAEIERIETEIRHVRSVQAEERP